jgi:hypothetical protein
VCLPTSEICLYYKGKTAQAELDYLAMKRENKNLGDENAALQARLRQFLDQMASQVSRSADQAVR